MARQNTSQTRQTSETRLARTIPRLNNDIKNTAASALPSNSRTTRTSFDHADTQADADARALGYKDAAELDAYIAANKAAEAKRVADEKAAEDAKKAEAEEARTGRKANVKRDSEAWIGYGVDIVKRLDQARRNMYDSVHALRPNYDTYQQANDIIGSLFAKIAATGFGTAMADTFPEYGKNIAAHGSMDTYAGAAIKYLSESRAADSEYRDWAYKTQSLSAGNAPDNDPMSASDWKEYWAGKNIPPPDTISGMDKLTLPSGKSARQETSKDDETHYAKRGLLFLAGAGIAKITGII